VNESIEEVLKRITISAMKEEPADSAVEPVKVAELVTLS
jgi:hypothetical protein